MNYLKKVALASTLLLTFFSCKKENTDAEPSPNGSLENANTTETASVTAASLITNLKSGTSETYQLGTLSNNVVYYTDRAYKFTSVPSVLSGVALIKTACDDKINTAATAITFTLSQNATIFIGYDSRADAIPGWLTGWKKLKEKIGTTDVVDSLTVYSKDFAAGPVSLGANRAVPAKDVHCQYIVGVKPGIASVPEVVVPVTPATGFMLGLNAHSMGNSAYSPVSISDQMAMMKKMGMKAVRVNFNANKEGSISNPTGFNQLVSAANANGITILAMINITQLNYNLSEDQNYAAGKVFGSNIATKNSKNLTYYELGNEIDNKIINSGNGDVASDYNAQKLKLTAAFLKGMDDGIKSKQPGAKTMIDGSWKHFYYLQYMQSYGVKFDIVAWHWYSDMESSTASSSSMPDITKKLSSLFTKPIWFTEAGQRWKNVSNIDQTQSDFTNAFIKKMKANSQVKAGLFYELFDEPARSGAEGHYGFIKWTTPYSKWEYKTVAKSLFVN